MLEIYKAYLQVAYTRVVETLTLLALSFFDRIGSYLRTNIEYNPVTDNLPMINTILHASINGVDQTSALNYLLYETWKESNYFSLSEIREKLSMSSTDKLVIVARILRSNESINVLANTPMSAASGAASETASEIHTVTITGNRWTVDNTDNKVPSFGIISNLFQ